MKKTVPYVFVLAVLLGLIPIGAKAGPVAPPGSPPAVSSGTYWIAPNCTTATGATVCRSAATAQADVLNALDYGLVCDGVTDNATAFSNIATRLSALTGKSVFFPAQNFPCMTSQPINAVSGATYRADPGTVTIKTLPGNTSNPMLVSASGVSNVLFYGLTFDGNLGSSPSSNLLMRVLQSTSVVFDHITVQNTRGIGLLFSTSVVNSGVLDSYFSNVGNFWQTSGQSADQQQGVAFCCNSGNMSNFVNNSYFTDIGLDAISAVAQTDFQANGNRFRSVGGRYSNGGAAVYASSDDGVQVVGNDVAGAFGNGLDLHALSHFTVTGNKVREAGGTGISVSAGTMGVVSGNLSLNSNQGNLSSLNSGLSIAGANVSVTWAGNTSTDDQSTPTQQYGFQGLGGSTCTNCTIDGSNELNGNALGPFGGTVTGYTSKVSATVTWGGQVGTGTGTGVQFNLGTAGAIMVGTHDASTAGGNLPGSGAIDLCTSRLGAAQVASGAQSGCVYGSNNTVSGQFASSGGTWNNADGPGSRAWGQFAQTRFRTGADIWASGQIIAKGDAQIGNHVLRASTTSTTPVRLTTDKNAPNTQNCINLPTTNFPTNQESAYSLSIRVVATDLTTPGNFSEYWEPMGLLSRSTAVSSTAYAPSSGVLSSSVGTGGTISVGADTSLSCLSVTWTAPNSDSWHVVARVDDVEAY